MKATAKAWRLSVLAAVLVHLVALAGWQMMRRRQPPPEGLKAADDTPMLLQFSREEPLALEAGSIPLPPAAPLPPPIGAQAPNQTALPGRDRGPGKPDIELGRKATAARTTQGKAGARPGAPRATSRLVRPKVGGSQAAPTPVAPLPLALGAGSPARLALEKGLNDAGSASAQEAPEPGRDEKADPRSGGGTPGPELAGKASGGDLARTPRGGAAPRGIAADLRLWTLAKPSRPAPGSLQGLPAELAVRELPLSQARASGADIRHRKLVRLDDGLLLLWVEDSTLWLVRSPLP
jgi:hypothetical protein